MRLAALAIVALCSSVALVGCGDTGGNISKSGASGDASTTTQADSGDDGGDTGDSDDPDREALITYVAGSDGNQLDRQQGDCVADAVLDDISDSGLSTVRRGGDFDLTTFESDDADLLVGALDDCVPLEDAVSSFQEGISGDAAFPLSDSEAECTSLSFSKEYKGSGEFIAAVTAMSEEEAGSRLFDAMGGCISVDSAKTFMTSTLSGQGMTDELSSCVAGYIVDQLGVEGLLDAISESGTTGTSKTLEDVSVAAGTECA